MPYIPFKSNSGPTWGKWGPRRTSIERNRWKRQGNLWRQMYHYYEFNQEWFFQQYHKRSNVETTFSMIKSKFGDGLLSKTKTAQTNEALCKVLCHNICCLIQSIFELGMSQRFGLTPRPPSNSVFLLDSDWSHCNTLRAASFRPPKAGYEAANLLGFRMRIFVCGPPPTRCFVLTD